MTTPSTPSTVSTPSALRAVARLAVSADALTCVDLVETTGGASLVDKHTLMTSDAAAARAALQELDILLTLQKKKTHQTTNVVALHSFRLDPASQRLHVVLEHCARGDLFRVAQLESGLLDAQKLAPHQALATGERALRRVAFQTLRGLRALHAIGVAHMDVSLENVFLTKQGDARLGDLGLAQRFQRDPHSGRVLPATHRLPVTKPAYAAPEMFAAARPVADVTKCDAWSLGVLLWHLVTRAPLFPTGVPTIEDPVLRAMIQAPAAWTDALLPRGTSPALRGLLMGLLDVNPSTRLSVDAATQHAWFKTARPAQQPTVATTTSATSKKMLDQDETLTKPLAAVGRRGRDRTVSAEISLEATRVAIRPSLLRRRGGAA